MSGVTAVLVMSYCSLNHGSGDKVTVGASAELMNVADFVILPVESERLCRSMRRRTFCLEAQTKQSSTTSRILMQGVKSFLQGVMQSALIRVNISAMRADNLFCLPETSASKFATTSQES